MKECNNDRTKCFGILEKLMQASPWVWAFLSSVLQCSATELSNELWENCNASSQECVVPAVWKMPSIIPVPREQNISSIDELPPVDLTCHLLL